MNEKELYEARIELVDFLIEVFWDAPSEAFLGRLLGDEISLPADSVNDSMDEGFETLRAWRAESRGTPIDKVHHQIEQEYTALFVGPRPPVLPHETYYREDTDFIGEGLATVEASYAAAGWTPPEKYPEENDFIAVELAFLRYLMQAQHDGREETFGFERVFLDEHLTHWIDPFLSDLRDEADSGLFLAAGLIFKGLIEFEDELIAQVVSG
ncbi:chaperone TorD involved in molybdoenzyme TorA maturation [Halogranum amylolyticum]|uniref:Chaperone TorD involved in molybdoenzyme TorA maturation n=1 Tax=Halogranum amylolyticum TaxID=660520 RepID=A0A1H8VEY9_9EURY|nr:molecular chaperone TorD family protein [Halogranum amylolyticum]SEP13843.1 chaperone TorD involved in molybdoenzyme TorA maturation [Halogranum amylolyticum]